MILSYKLLVYCLVGSGFYLLITSGILWFLEIKIKFWRGMPEELLEDTGGAWFVINYIMEMLFYVIIPTIAYAFFYLVIPLGGVRAGIAVALIAFTLGAVPILMSLSVRVKLPMSYLLFMLLAYMIKLGGSLAIIGYLYAL